MSFLKTDPVISVCDPVLQRRHVDAYNALKLGKEQVMKKNMLYLIGGIIAGVALCLATASMIPLDPHNDKDLWE